jgi:extracellular elastinolytic metalloproteinase
VRDAIILAVDNKRAAGQLDAAHHARARHAILSTFAHFGMGPAASSNGATLKGIVFDFTAPAPPVGPPPGAPALRGEASPALAIPDNIPAGVTSKITTAGAGTVANSQKGRSLGFISVTSTTC